MPNSPVAIYNRDLELVAYLENAAGISYKKRKGEVWSASFCLPADDPKNDECQDFYYAEIFDGDERIELFRIILSRKSRIAGKPIIKYECKHVLSTLNDDTLVGVHNAGPGVEAALDYIIGKQVVAHWQLGTVEFVQNFYHYWKDLSLLAALYTIPERFLTAHRWTFDTESHPWTLNLLEAPTTVDARITYQKNMRQIDRKSDVRNLYTRLYAYGYGAGASQVDISGIDLAAKGRPGFTSGSTEFTVGETLTGASSSATAKVKAWHKVEGAWDGDAEGVVFLTDVAGTFTDGEDLNGSVSGDNCATLDSSLECVYAEAVVTYGVITRKWEDQRYTIVENLYAAAEEKVDANAVPELTYTVKAADLYRLTKYVQFVLGDLVKVYDEPLGIDVDARIVTLSKKDVEGKPGDIGIQLGNTVEKFPDFGGIVYADDLDQVKDGIKWGRVLSTQILAGEILLSAVPGSTIGAFPATPTVAGLYLGATHFGFHDGTNWKTFMDINGNFYLGGTSGKLQWNAGTDTLTIVGAITATTGAIGGWVIGTHTLTADSGAVGLSSEATGGVDWRIWAGHATPASAPFRVDESGNLVASAATITGAITASSGEVGGWTIGASTLTAGAGASSVGLAPGSYPFYAGNAIPGSAPFSVSAAGALIATSATITGAITSSSVTITGGTLNINSGVFSVSAAGALVATSATITGTITGNAGTIGGFTISSTDGLYSGSGATRIQMKVGTGLWLGTTAFAGAPFRVSPAGAVTCSNLNVTGGVWGGDTLTAVKIPNLDCDKIVSGTFGAVRIPSLDCDKITSGTFGTVRIPNLSCSKITSGTFDAVRIPNLSASKITTDTMSAARILGGTIGACTISADNITAGTLIGRTIQTDTSGPAVILSAEVGIGGGQHTLAVFDATWQRTLIGAGAITLYDAAGNADIYFGAAAVDSYVDCSSFGVITHSAVTAFSVNQGSGNGTADDWVPYSLKQYKEDLREASVSLDTLKKLKIFDYRRVPFVSARELRDTAIAEFGLKRWERLYPDDKSYRGGALWDCPDPGIKTFLDKKGDALRTKRRGLVKWQHRHYGMIADDPSTKALVPELIAYDDAGNIIGLALGDQVGFLFSAVQELARQVETLQS